MCLAVPTKIVSINGTTATLDMNGNSLKADISMVPSAQIGDWVLVHAGFVIEKYNEQEALETLKLLGEIAAMEGKA